MKQRTHISTVYELGANIGLNVSALKLLLQEARITAVEINKNACAELSKLDCEVLNQSILSTDFNDRQFDLVLTSGVLIHINPERLGETYDLIAETSRRYVLISEYFNPSPVQVSYRGHEERLFKRDFAGEFLDAHPEFELVDYGFRYSRGLFPSDNFNWFMMQRSRS